MAEKFIVTNYERNEFVSLIREAFSEEFKAILKQKEQENDYDELLTRKEAARFLKISLNRKSRKINDLRGF